MDLGGRLIRDRLWFFVAYDRVDLPGEVSRREDSLLVPASARFPLDATNELISGKLTWNIAPSSMLVGTVFADPTTNSGAGRADPRQGQFAVRPIVNPDPGTWEADRRIGATDYGLRFQQLLESRAVVSLQGARHEDRYELRPAGAGDAVRIEDWTCEGGTPESPCVPPPVANFAEGGLGRVSGDTDNNASRRDQYRADADIYLSNHEIKLGGDYHDSKTKAVSYFTGRQFVNRFNDFGQTYYEHRFYASSLTDLTPVDNVSEPETREIGAYVQDSWRITPSLTVNAGLRWDQEDIRDYRGITVLETTNEWQPRLGIVWDPKGDGSTKLYAFAGRFYYSLPTDLSVRAFGNSTFFYTYNFDPTDVTPDPSAPWETSNSGGPFGSPVDAGIRGIYQDELTVGVEKALDPAFSVALKGTYRRLGRAIEDRCDLDRAAPENNDSSCGIFNPGSDGPIARGEVPGCNGLLDSEDAYTCTETIPAVPGARRLYRGVEILARKSVGDRAWLQGSYVYSSLRGNYNGEVTAEGQTDPGINGDFDFPEILHNAYGRLYLDRPHSFRLDGFYRVPFGLFVGFQGYVRSGAPTNRLGYLNYFGYQVHLVKKGYEGRLPTAWEANLTFGYPFAIGPVTVTAQMYVFNLFNNQIATNRDNAWSVYAPPDWPASLYDPNQEQNNPEYGKTTARTEPRLFRAAVRISF